MLKGMLLVINVWGKWVRMQGCVGKRGSWGGCDSPTCMVTKCKGIQRSGGEGAEVTREGRGEEGAGRDGRNHCKLTICTLEGGQVS